MTKLVFAGLLFLAFGCASDDGSMVEDGLNPRPNRRPAGSSARSFLTAENYTALDIEILYVTGFRPNSSAVAALETFLQSRLHKPDGIRVTLREIPSPGTSPYTNAEIEQLEDDYRNRYNETGTLTLCILFVDGNSANDVPGSVILGSAYLNTSCVIYEKTVRAFSNGINPPTTAVMEGTVLLHEISHLLGLVRFGTPMVTPHEDPSRKRHCENTQCLMYWAAQNQVIMQGSEQIPTLDANCIADLRANGGK